MDEPKNELKDKIEKQQRLPIERIVNIQSVYANTFQVGLSLSDIIVTLMINGQPFQSINMSLTTAKSLAENLNRLITEFEGKTGTKVLLIREVAEKVKPK